MAFCKTCRTNATAEFALKARRCVCCGCTDYILPGISAPDLAAYYANRGRWNEAKAALLAADLDPVMLNEQHGILLDKRECADWVERMELMALPCNDLHDAISERYDDGMASWYCDSFLGGYNQRWQTSASVKASGPMD